jgi:hypothetical protein
MKRLLLFGMVATLLTIVGVQRASAQASYNFTYTQGVEVAAGDDYFLYNIGTGMFLTDGMDHGTHASVDHAGRVITLAAATNGFSIYTKPYSANGSDEKAGYMTLNGYVDTSNNDADWVFTPVNVDGYTNAYTIKNSDTQYLYYEVKDELYGGKAGQFINVGENTNDEYSYWLLIPMSARQEAKDYTYLLRNTEFQHPWELVMWNNTAEWTNYCGGKKENTCAEMIDKAFDVSQTISATVENGKYKVYAQAFWRDNDATKPSYLYANNDQSELRILNSGEEGTDHNMNGASDAFTAGQYTNSVTTTVTNGQLKVGIKTEGTNWTIFDNFYLEYLGPVLNAIAEVLPDDGDMVPNKWYSLVIGEEKDYVITATTFNDIIYVTDGNLTNEEAQTQNTTFNEDEGKVHLTAGTYYIMSSSDNNFDIAQDYTLAEGKMNAEVAAAQNSALENFEDNPTRANYNALIEAINNAKASIAVYQQIATLFTEQQMGSIQGWTDAKVYTDYNDGVYETLQQALDAYKTYVANYWSTTTPGENADLTAFIINPSLNFGDATGWSGGGVNQGNIEWYNGNYDVNQTLSGLPTGTYKLQAQGYYRPGDNENASTDQNALLYGGTSTQPVVLITSAGKDAKDEDNGFTEPNTNRGSEVYYVPNSQADAAKAFATGAYKNEVTFVVSNGTVNIGFKKDVLIANDWTCFDNFRLIYLSADATVKPTIPTGPMNKDVKAALEQAEEAYDAVAGKTIDNYNALVTAIDNANASIAIYQTMNKYITAQKATAGTTINWSDIDTKYSTGEYVSATDFIADYHALVVNALGETTTANTDMTPYIINPGFEFADNTGWNGGGAVAGLDGQKNIESYNSDNFNIHQVLTDLPNGTYTLTVQGFYRPGDNNNRSDAQNAELYGNDKSIAVKLVASEGKAAADGNGFTTENTNSGSSVYVPDRQNDGSLVFANAENYVNTLTIIVSDGTATIGVRKNNHIAYDWALFDNFTLTFTSADLPSDFKGEIDALIADIDLTKKMNGETRAEYVAAINTWNAAGGKTAENYGKVLAAAPKAQASIVAYERALAAINETLILLTETNVYTSDGYSALFRTYNNYMSSYNNELLDDNAAVSIHGAIFGSGAYQQTNVAAVPFLGSAWDDQGDYTWRGIREKNEIFEENFWNYWVNTWSNEGATDGSNFTVPFMEYITDDNKTLTDRELTATVPAAPKETYTVTGFIRARVADGAEPTGIGLRLLNKNDEIIGNATINWTRVGETEFWTASPTVSGGTPGEISATDGGELTTLKIQFYFKQTNSSWFAFKNMMYSPAHTVDAQDFVNIMVKMNDAIVNAESHTLGFDYKDDTHGTSVDEYAPYRHAEQLADLELLKAYKVALDNLIVEYNNHEIDDATFVQRAPRYILTNSLITKVAEAQWTPNTNEENAIFWRDNYTADDVVVLQYYNDDGTPTNARFNTILPTGWDLNGRTDAYNTRIQKNGVNTNAPGTWAVKGQTALFVKWNTNYGKQTGYTLPLKPGVKYAFQFNYCGWGNEGETFDDDTEIRIVNKRTGHTVTVTDYGTSQGGGNETPNKNWILLEGRPQQGNLYEQNWYMFRGEFKTEAAADDEYTDDYEIYFDKQVKNSQQQIALGDITLVRAPEETKKYVINGDTRDEEDDFTPAFDYESERKAIVTRTFNYNGGAGTWNTFVLPFKMDQKETEAMLGEGVELAYYIDCTLEGTYYTLNFEKHKAGVLANRPCMVYYDSEKSLNNYVVDYAIVRGNNEKPETLDPKGVLDMVGTYKILDIPADDIYISPDNQWKRSKGNTKLQPTRAYFRNVSGDSEVGAKLMGFRIDDVATGIMAIDDETGDMHVTSGNIYSLDGRLVRQNAKSLEGLQPGIYVVDGKKYYVK